MRPAAYEPGPHGRLRQLGAATVLTGALPGPEAREVALARGGPVMVFLVAITVLAALADKAGCSMPSASARGLPAAPRPGCSC